jgi:LEA14-like dessication related protein
MRSVLVLALVVLGTTGCAVFFQEPTVRVLDVRVASLGLTSGNARVELEVINPNRYGLRVQSFDYILEVEDGNGGDGWASLATGSAPDAIPVAGRDTTFVSLDVPFEYRAVHSAISAYMRDGRVGYRFRGDAVVRGPLGNVSMPFDQRGEL